LTLVMRDTHHVTLTHHMDYVEALHQALAPQRPAAEFVLMLAAMPAREFQKEQAPAQALLQQRAMQAVVGAGEHSHEASNDAGPGAAPFEIRAEATSARRIESVAARLPVEFGNVLLVSYQPKQAWVKRGSAGTLVTF